MYGSGGFELKCLFFEVKHSTFAIFEYLDIEMGRAVDFYTMNLP